MSYHFPLERPVPELGPVEHPRHTRPRTFAGVVYLSLLLVFGSSTGCATYRLTSPDSDETDTQYEQETVHIYFWGSFSSPEVVEGTCKFGGDYINDVKVIDHLGFDFISVLTLGIWKPITIQWRCKPGGGPDPVPVPFPTDGT